MKKIQMTVEIELTDCEKKILNDAKMLLQGMKDEVEKIEMPLFENDLTDIENCLECLLIINERYKINEIDDNDVSDIFY